MITDKMLEENTTPWGLLSEEMKEAFHKCSVSTLEVYNGTIAPEEWTEVLCRPPSSLWVIRKRPATKPVIPWEFIKEEYKWAAKDEEDNLFIFTVKPKLVTLGWWDLPEIAMSRCPYGEYRLLKGLAIDFGTCDWKDSLVERPK